MAGAPKGNHNALKHGFYSRLFTPQEHAALAHARPDPLDEIACLRTHASRLNAWLLARAPASYDESYFTALNTLVNLNISIATLLRTHALLTGRSSNIEQAIQTAILSARSRWVLA